MATIRQTQAYEGSPLVAWIIIGLAGIITLIRVFLSFIGADSPLMETMQVIMIFAALLYILIVNFPRFRAAVPHHELSGPLPSDPPLAQFFSAGLGSASFWFTVRMYVGFSWFSGAIGKFLSPAWWNGDALKGFWSAAVAPPQDSINPAVAFEWYRQLLAFMLQNHWYTWFNWVIMFGELFIGLGLLFGLLTGFAAFFGALLNFSYGLAGVAGVNPLLLVLAILIIMSWKVVGWYGLDRFLLPWLGTSWQPGTAFHHKTTAPPVSSST